MTLRTLALLLGLQAVALLGACSPDFAPASAIDKLHLLAVQAEPPEIAPSPEHGATADAPDRAHLSALVADPRHLADPTWRSSVVYLACTPRPDDSSTNPCLRFEALGDLAALIAESGAAAGACESLGAEFGTGVVGGVTFAGIEECDGSGCRPPFGLPAPTYVLPPDLRLEGLPAGAGARANGVVVVVVALTLDAPPEDLLVAGLADPCVAAQQLLARLQQRSSEGLISIKRLTVRGPDATDEPNRNPAIPGITANGTALPDPSLDYFAARSDVSLLPLLPVGADGEPLPPERFLQSYTKRDGSGLAIRIDTEQWVYSWYSTAGTLKELHTKKLDAAETWTAPGDAQHPIPTDGRLRLYAVVRDQRGGVAWTMRETRVAP